MYGSMQISKLNSKNWLIKTAGITLCLAFLILIINRNNINNSRIFYDNSLFSFILTALLLAPISEELLFRIHFLKKYKFYKFLSLIILSIIIFYKSNILVSVLFLIYIALYLIREIKINLKYDYINVLFILNSFIFAFLHYKFEDFYILETYGYIFFQFSLSLSTIWILINFNLLKSILFHIIWNLIPISYLIFILIFPSQLETIIRSKSCTLTYKKVSIINNEKSFINENNSIIAKNMTIKEFLFFLNSNSKNKYYQIEPFINYEIKVNANSKINSTEIEELLIENKIIGVKK
jgi:membrane protease YdiL (CAAX protease family)